MQTPSSDVMEAAPSPPVTVFAVASKKKRKKPKYSRNLRDLQKLERASSKAQLRLARAVVNGLKVWDKRRNKSASKRRDGAVRDALINSAWALGRVMRDASRGPVDFVEEIRPQLPTARQVAKRLRRLR